LQSNNIYLFLLSNHYRSNDTDHIISYIYISQFKPPLVVLAIIGTLNPAIPVNLSSLNATPPVKLEPDDGRFKSLKFHVTPPSVVIIIREKY